jgi:hypothetical protein
VLRAGAVSTDSVTSRVVGNPEVIHMSDKSAYHFCDLGFDVRESRAWLSQKVLYFHHQ